MAITQTEPVSEETYRRLALADPGGQLELYQGQLRKKPGMSVEHGDIMFHLGMLLQNQLDRGEYRLRASHARLRRSADTYDVPDIAVIPTAGSVRCANVPAVSTPILSRCHWLSRSGPPQREGTTLTKRRQTISSVATSKFGAYTPNERTITVWRSGPDSSYTESIYRDGTRRLGSLPGVAIDLDTLFET